MPSQLPQQLLQKPPGLIRRRAMSRSAVSSCPLVCRGLEQALDHYAQPAASATASEAAGTDEKGRDARRSMMREKRKKALKHLSVAERDVLTVLSAVCKVSTP